MADITILQQVEAKGTDILTFLSEKYGCSRSLVKRSLFMYSYSSTPVLEMDKFKFKQVDTLYAQMVNDYIDYSIAEGKRNLADFVQQKSDIEDCMTNLALTRDEIRVYQEALADLNLKIKILKG